MGDKRTDAATHSFATRWTTGVLVIFTLYGLSFGSWLSRIPAVRDHLGASTLEISVLGLTLALGSVSGLIISGRTVAWLGPRRAIAITVVTIALAMPIASALLWIGLVPFAMVFLAIFGFAFSTGDVAMNVSGANAERLLGKPRMPLLHAGFSLGSVTAMGLGALAESYDIAVPVHLTALFALVVAAAFIALRRVPRDETIEETTDDAEQLDAAHTLATTHTGPVGIIDPKVTDAEPAGRPGSGAARATRRPYSAWRDPRILIVGLIAMSASFAEGTASDWLPLALADGRGFSNEAGALTLGVLFVTMTLARLAGSPLITRFGRVRVLQASGVFFVLGVVLTILVPFGWASVIGAVMWGLGAAFGFPIGISAAADDPKTAVRGVAAVAAIAYTAFLLGPILIGFLGERFGLLAAFWPLVGFGLFIVLFAGFAREPVPEQDTRVTRKG